MKIGLIITVFLLLCISSAQGRDMNNMPADTNGIRIAVLSDLHVMVPELVEKDGNALENYIKHDRKLLKESTAIIQKAISELIEEKPQLVLVTGDMTKDGEYICHRYIADSCLNKLKKAGIKVLVVPGNHDINNPHAMTYNGDVAERTKTVSPQEFTDIYSEYGYKDAIARDKNSLTYVAQPFKNLIMICIDACQYKKNDFKRNICQTSGKIKRGTLKFISMQLKDANSRGIPVMVMMHQGLVEHWDKQAIVMKDYLVSPRRKVAEMLAKGGVNYVFTGHFHAQDIVKYTYKGHSLYDIETGSVVTYPMPYRLMTLNNGTLDIRSKYIRNFNYNSNVTDYAEYAKANIAKDLELLLSGEIPKKIPVQSRDKIIKAAIEAIIAHFKGDEQIDEQQKQRLEEAFRLARVKMPIFANLYIKAVKGLWNDREPADNNVVLGKDSLASE